MYQHDLYSFRPAANCVIAGQGTALLLAPPHKEKLTELTPSAVDALKRLSAEPTSLADLSADDDVVALVTDLATRGWLSITARWEGQDLYTIRPFRAPATSRPTATSPGRVLSKFAVVRRGKQGAVVEHPMSWCDIDIHSPYVLDLVCGVGSADDSVLPPDVAERVAADLAWTGHTVADSETEERGFTTRSWGAHELWFHRQSNVSDRVLSWEEFGPTRWADGTFPPLPNRKASYPGAAIALPSPDLDTLRDSDRTLTEVIEDRVSTRDFDDAAPLTLAQLGELLYRTARTRSERTAKGVEYQSRPYPSGGAVYELELYPVVRNVAGLDAGMYHYDSFEHALRPVAEFDTPVVERLLRVSSLTLSEGQQPQVLIALAARAGRLMWTYEQVPYAIILKHVGVVLQTTYLVATAMGLGAVAQGYGDTAAFAEAAQVDELDECLVGSIVVGNPRSSINPG